MMVYINALNFREISKGKRHKTGTLEIWKTTNIQSLPYYQPQLYHSKFRITNIRGERLYISNTNENTFEIILKSTVIF